MKLFNRTLWCVIGLSMIALAGPDQLSIKFKPAVFPGGTFACENTVSQVAFYTPVACRFFTYRLQQPVVWPSKSVVLYSAQQGKKDNDAGFFLRIFGALGHGVVTAVQCGLVGGGLLPDLIDKNNPKWSQGFAVGFGVGYCLGSGLGAHWVGKKMGQQGSKTAAVIGGFLGAFIAYELSKDSEKGWGYIVGPPVMAALCFSIAPEKAGQ